MRCVRTAKMLRATGVCDLDVVALYTDLDREAPYVRHADMAVRLPTTTTAVAAYLDHDLLIRTLQDIGADAVWPGWGFVAESPEFVDRLEAAGIRFLGPTGETMRQLGDKIASKNLAERVGVPVTDWSKGVVADEAAAQQAGEEIGYPLVVKASAGGGGRGIRMVHSSSEIGAAFRSASSEAKGAFGDDRLFMESMVQGGRHIEVQVVADQHGNVHAVGCRDCSVQRRHQKVLEEAPPPFISDELLEAMREAARRLASEVGYSGVGTVEFLMRGEEFFFLEMNPRLQVEHGITEVLTSLDLVQQQIRIAQGESLADLTWSASGFCIEARVCAEDPDQGFLPAPGRIALFDMALGPNIRIDTGVAAGSHVPPAFDSLIAKVMAYGDTREQARGRLVAALRDTDLVIEGGATNKPYLLQVLETDGYREGGVDTGWLDRWNAERSQETDYVAEALVLAAILAYRSAYRSERKNFFQDTSTVRTDVIPALEGRELDLEYAGESYRLEVFSVGAMRYRVHMDGKVISARFGESTDHTARMVIYGRYLRAVYDTTDAYVHVEVEGCVHRFGRQTAGQLRAGAPSMVVAVHVEPGDRVDQGQPLGLLEAMKMEIAFNAPVAGKITEVRIQRGQQVGAGEVMVVIDPASDLSASGRSLKRLVLPAEVEPLAALFEPSGDVQLGTPNLEKAMAAPPAERRLAMAAVGEEVLRLLLGFDVYPARFNAIVAFLEAPLPDGLSDEFLEELSQVREQLTVFSDVERLFTRTQPVSEGGALGPSNNARMRGYLRRMRSEGTGVAEEFLELLRTALGHYAVQSLELDHALERAVLRMFAAQKDPTGRHQLVMSMLRRVIAAAQAGVNMSGDEKLRSALTLMADMRGKLSNALADTVLEAHYHAFQAPELRRASSRTSERVGAWLAAADESDETPPPVDEVLHELAHEPDAVIHRMLEWLGGGDRWRHVIAQSAFLRRLYAPRRPSEHRSARLDGGHGIDILQFDGTSVLGAGCLVPDVATVAAALVAESDGDDSAVLELLVRAEDAEADEGETIEVCVEAARSAVGSMAAQRLTLSLLGRDRRVEHRTLVAGDGGVVEEELGGLHPEAAVRVDLRRYQNFDLERLWGSEGVYCFHARAKTDPGDERIFVLGDVRGRPVEDSHDARLMVPMFERAFQETTRTLRLNLGIRDPRRKLQWNRVVMHVAHAVSIDAPTAQRLARRLLTHVRHLGIEKTIVRLKLVNAERPDDPPNSIEAVFADLASSRLEMQWRRPRRAALAQASAYERRVASARRRGDIYPYEVIRMLTRGGGADAQAQDDGSPARPELPVGEFAEYDIEVGDDGRPKAIPVQGRPIGTNTSAVVFGVISTPTEKIPEGMQRVLVMSDPTRDMGALAPAECDRVLAAIDLAEQRSLPVEWLPVSAGARIAMESGTENLDATARVVERIVTFTQTGGVIHVIVTGINIGAQSYWDSLATMLMHTRGVLIMTPGASMVLTGRVALAASGSISAEDEVSIGGHERIMGPNGEAQYFAPDLLSAYTMLYDHYRYTYVVPGEAAPRTSESADAAARDVCEFPYVDEGDEAATFARVGEIFDPETNPGRKRPFSMRALMKSVIDTDGGHLERWSSHVGAETAIVWDAHLGGQPVCLLGIESRNVPRYGYRPPDGPEDWNGATLFPQSSKKIAHALNAASGNRPVVMLANLSGFDGSPESMRKLQLEYGAEIARAVVNFEGPIVFLVVSRYHGGAYVVFSRMLNPNLRAFAVEGSYASVIGGGPAATVIFPREVRARVAADPRIQALREKITDDTTAEDRAEFDRARRDVTLEKRAEIANEFDAIHSVERAKEVGSLEGIIDAKSIRPHLISVLREYD